MLGRVEISKLEHRLILFATSIIPVFAFCFILVVLSKVFYEYIFPTPPQPNFSIDDFGAKPTLPLFRICVVVSLTISFTLLVYKRFFLSILTFILPIITFVASAFAIYWIVQERVQEILGTTRDLETINYYKKKNLIEIVFSSFDNVDIVFLTFIVILFFWQISILLRMLIKTSQRKMELP